MAAAGLFSGATALKPDCIIGKKHGTGCLPGMGGCLIAYPPGYPWSGNKMDITLYEPADTGEGSTGIQMAIVFMSPYPGGGIFMPPAEGNAEVYPAYAQELGLDRIEVIASGYEILYSSVYPDGYIIVDVEVE